MSKRRRWRWRTVPHVVRHASRTAKLLSLLAAAVVVALTAAAGLHVMRRDEEQVFLFIAIGSAPRNAALRQAARDTWLRWLPDDGSVQYRFFSDAPPFHRGGGGGTDAMERMFDASDGWSQLVREAALQKDLMLQPLPSGYGDREHNVYSRRALFQFKWTMKRFANIRYLLRVDDDSFLCVHKLLYELQSVPKQQFFWGKFWCREGRNRADENFMLFSKDVIELLCDDQVGKLLPFDEEVTLGWNFGYWSWTLNLSIFDDQQRIDAQQQYVTQYMHGDHNFSDDFCERYLYAHHVGAHAMRHAFHNLRPHVMYKLPRVIGPRRTCASEQRSFIARRHSRRLPDVKISRADGS